MSAAAPPVAEVTAAPRPTDLTTIPMHGVAPSHVVLATRADDRSRPVAAFRRSARDCLTAPLGDNLAG